MNEFVGKASNALICFVLFCMVGIFAAGCLGGGNDSNAQPSSDKQWSEENGGGGDDE